MQKIIPHLWFDKEAVEAAELYTAAFDNSAITSRTVIHQETPYGDSEIVVFTILGYEFNSISAGPYFKINPSISFHMKCESVEEVDRLVDEIR